MTRLLITTKYDNRQESIKQKKNVKRYADEQQNITAPQKQLTTAFCTSDHGVT